MIDHTERHAFIDESIERFYGALCEPAVAARLGSSVTTLAGIADRLVIPNIRDDVLMLPPPLLDSEQIPVIALATGEKVLLPGGDFGLTPLQRLRLEQEITGLGPKRETPRQFVDFFDTQLKLDELFTMPRGTWGGVQANEAIYTHDDDRLEGLRKNGRLFVVGRALLVLSFKYGFTSAGPSTMGHECIHIEQTDEAIRPLGSGSDAAKMLEAEHELPAYFVGGKIGYGLREAGRAKLEEYEAIATWEDLVRHDHPGADPLVMTPYKASQLTEAA